MINLLCVVILLILLSGPDPTNLILMTGIIMMVIGGYLFIYGLKELIKEVRRKR